MLDISAAVATLAASCSALFFFEWASAEVNSRSSPSGNATRTVLRNRPPGAGHVSMPAPLGRNLRTCRFYRGPAYGL